MPDPTTGQRTLGDMLDELPPVDDLVLVFDTETTGLPIFSAPSDHEDQPHIVSLAAELCRSDGTVIETYNQIVKVGVPIPADTIAIHGITDEIANAQGIEPKQMLADFFALVDRASVVLGYNTGFDLRMVRIQSARHLGVKWECPKPKDDAMYIVTKAMNCKKPKLTAAYEMVFGRTFEGAHNALADTTAAREIYFEMRNRGHVAVNPRGLIGANSPPEDEKPREPTPFERTQKEVDDLYEEALNWCDGEPIANAEQAAEIGELRKRIQAAAKVGEERRVAEAKPFDEAKKKVQDAYNPLIHKEKGKTARALSALNTALAPYLAEIDRQQREAARVLREQQVEAERIAREASMAAAKTTNLREKEEAERLQDEAKAIAKTADAAEKAKAQVHATGGGRAIGMKSVWTAELVDPAAAIEYFRRVRPAEMKEWMREQAKNMIHVGPKPPGTIPGFTITETKVPV